MIPVETTDNYRKWVFGLKDDRAIAKITARVDRLSFGNPGDVKPVGQGISEMRIDYGPGYRVYYARNATTIIILLVGGTKKTQARDIKHAKQLYSEWTAG